MREPVKNVEELERLVGLVRTVPNAPTRKDALNMRKKRLGPKWGKSK